MLNSISFCLKVKCKHAQKGSLFFPYWKRIKEFDGEGEVLGQEEGTFCDSITQIW